MLPLNLFPSTLLLALVLLLCTQNYYPVDCKTTVTKNKQRNRDNKKSVHNNHEIMSSISLSNGMTLPMHDTKAFPLLSSWAKEIDSWGGSVSHQVASHREYMVVDMVNKGTWSMEAYHDYQRLVANTGNVDSARLLLEYSIAPAVFGINAKLYSKTNNGNVDDDVDDEDILMVDKLREYLVQCNIKKFQKLIIDHGEEVYDIKLSSSAAPDGLTLLMAASFTGCVEIADAVIKHEISNNGAFDIDYVNANGMTALMVAAATNIPDQAGSTKQSGKSSKIKEIKKSKSANSCHQCDMLRLLVAAGANVNALHKFASSTALHMAAELSRSESVITLCSLGANKSITTATGSTPLHSAAHSGADGHTIQALVNNCKFNVDELMNEDTTALYLAAHHGHANTVAALAELGANLDFAMPRVAYKGSHDVSTANNAANTYGLPQLNSEPGNGATALHTAAEEGHAEVARALIQHGAQINSLAMGVTPLHLAVQYHRPDVVQVLVEAGADVNIRTYSDKATPLYYAAGLGNLQITMMLIRAGANMTVTQQAGGFPLFYAAMIGNAEIVQALLQAGAPEFQRTPDEMTALFAAAVGKHVAAFKALLCGLESKFTCNKSSELHQKMVRKRLLIKGSEHRTLLHIAVSSIPFSTEIQEVLSSSLIKHSSSFSVVSDLVLSRDDSGALPIHVAARHGYLEAVKWLFSLEDNYTNVDEAIVGSPDVDTKFQSTACQRALSDDALGPTPLYLASISQENGSEESSIDSWQEDKSELIRLLLSKGCDANAVIAHKTESGKVIKATSLLAAIDRNDIFAVKALVRGSPFSQNARSRNRNSNPRNSRDANRADVNLGIPSAGVLSSPILLAVARGRAEIVRELLKNGALCNIVIQTSATANNPNAGETLVDISRRKRDFDVLKVLTSYERCDPDRIRASLSNL